MHEIRDDGRLPLPDETCALVINRHESYDPAEVRRVLRPGGRFITQQVGGKDGTDLNRLLKAPNPDSGMPDWDLELARAQLETAGFKVIKAVEEFPLTSFTDVGAVVYYLKAIPWQIPDFSVDRYAEGLLDLERHIQSEGKVLVRSHRFLLRATKPS